ncbi:MAG: phosphate ABC transporter permease subunit PstC [Lachnospiraceae bacterium]|nr:phosphate ABC transporter permease subunit PstC [Lachnospiraceae bacterium]
MKAKENSWNFFVRLCGGIVIALPIVIGIFLIIRGNMTFTKYHHSIIEFLFSSNWAPADDMTGGGHVGSAVYIVGSLITCGLALLISVPFSMAAAIFMTEIAPKGGNKVLRPAVELFVGIPSVVYGWMGMTILVPFIKKIFNINQGYGVLSASLVLAIMIFPSITTVAADAIRSVPDSARKGAYGMGATRWQVIYQVVVPAAKTGIMSGVVLGLARAFGEALAVAMVIGKTRSFPKGILSPTTNLTSAIASDMGGVMEGGEYNAALWSMALLLFLISLLFIFIIHRMAGSAERKEKKLEKMAEQAAKAEAAANGGN